MSRNVYLTRGLVGRDQDIDLFEQVFEESQVVTVETANPRLDLISFAQGCSDFWVINTGDSVSNAVIVQEPPLLPNNCLGLHPTPGLTPPHEVALMHAGHESITDGAHLEESLMECPDTRYGVEDTASPQPIDRNAAYPSLDAYRPSEDKNIAGFVYLLPSSRSPDALYFEEYNVGIILRPYWRGLGVAEEAMRLALDVVFARHNVHRVQARLIDCYENDRAFAFFTRMGFSHEGTRRQAFFSPLTSEWKDVTTLALLATDWLLYIRGRRNDFRPTPKSELLWDSLFKRHQKEREELLRWHERNLCRNASLETIREGIVPPVPVPIRSDTEITLLGVSGNPERPKRKLFEIEYGDASDSDALTSEYGSERENEYTKVVEDNPPKRFRSRWDDTMPRIDGANRGEEAEMHAEGSPGCIAIPPVITVPSSMDQLHKIPESSNSRGSSVLSVPSSESESETEIEEGYASLSAESSTWELVESGDILGA
ncbi:hypothetical protein AGABI2DRAFT_180118 [Agaricus bisporus var. bisporus H97]|uniref:hypothetical protein n=1 Tax=Agaricus bisporus var. bisporus (strain H97 / ATCC MYA-4626 / FGSC 10389) TaxID=936046 RepID=UPI00029F731B|nr:hypothetical protein AGABI2DRAFT_180118 [Agaricus bisporus var. bisporus H97]EKV44649.1 hypothetical protein AGABI2DRAFT_180118 [Agaricus bisporus var. bisporus H97]